MYLTGVISHLEGWHLLSTHYEMLFEELKQLVDDIELPQKVMGRHMDGKNIFNKQYDMKELNQQFLKTLSDKNWQVDERVRAIDGVKNNVGIGLWLGKIQFSLTDLFVMLPNAVKLKDLELTVFLVPQRSVSHIGAVSFEQINSALSELTPLPLNYPFVILGFGPEKSLFSVNELTNPINLFLISTIGHTLEDVLVLGEGTNYEFKEQLPSNKVLAQEICGFANNKGGGVILLGVSDSGKVTGIDNGQSDLLQLQITNIVRDSCFPTPEIKFFKFIISNGQTVLVAQISELEHKPCLTSGKTYIRVGPSVRVATSEEIRKLILA